MGAYEAGSWFQIGDEIGYTKGLQHRNQVKGTHLGRSANVILPPRNSFNEDKTRTPVIDVVDRRLV
jgi:hypothetical protein